MCATWHSAAASHCVTTSVCLAYVYEKCISLCLSDCAVVSVSGSVCQYRVHVSSLSDAFYVPGDCQLRVSNIINIAVCQECVSTQQHVPELCARLPLTLKCQQLFTVIHHRLPADVGKHSVRQSTACRG